MRGMIQINLIEGYGTILRNFYESIVICKRLKPHLKHITLIVNCEHTQYFESTIFSKLFNLDYLKSHFDDIVVNDKSFVNKEYNGITHVYTRDEHIPGEKDWDLFLDGDCDEIRYLFDHRIEPRLLNTLSVDYNETPKITIDEEFNLFSDYVMNEYQNVKKSDYVTIQWRSKIYDTDDVTNMTNPIDLYEDEFKKIIKSNNLVYVCGNFFKLKEKLSSYQNVFFIDEVLNQEDGFHNIKDLDLLLKQNLLTIFDILMLKDTKHIYHFTWFGKLSLFLILPYINRTPITMYTFPSDIINRGEFNGNIYDRQH
jgi:hypothetical protein